MSLEEEFQTNKRILILMKVAGIGRDEARLSVEKLAGLSDTAFEAHATYLGKGRLPAPTAVPPAVTAEQLEVLRRQRVQGSVKDFMADFFDIADMPDE
jgi:hypothetical protein